MKSECHLGGQPDLAAAHADHVDPVKLCWFGI